METSIKKLFAQRIFVLLALVLVVAACTGDDPVASTTQPATETTTAASPTTTTTTAPIFAADEQALWITDRAGENVVRVTAVDPDEVTNIEVGLAAQQVAVSDGFIWVVGDQSVRVLDAASSTVSATIDLAGPISSIVVTDQGPWVLQSDPGAVVPLKDLTAGTEIAVNQPVVATAVAGALWVAGPNELVGVNTVTGERTTSFETTATDPAGLAVVDAGVMIISHLGDAIVLDPATGSLVNESSYDIGTIVDSAVVADGIWLLDAAGQLVKVNNDLSEGPGIEVGVAATAFSLTLDAAWVISGEDKALVRIALDDYSMLVFPLAFEPTDIASS